MNFDLTDEQQACCSSVKSKFMMGPLGSADDSGAWNAGEPEPEQADQFALDFVCPPAKGQDEQASVEGFDIAADPLIGGVTAEVGSLAADFHQQPKSL